MNNHPDYKKTLDKPELLCYNKDRKKERKIKMFIPKAKELQSIMQKNHREKAYRQMLAKNASKGKSDFVKQLEIVLSNLSNGIKNAVIYNNNNFIYYFGNYVAPAEKEKMLQVLIKIFTKKGFTVERKENSLKISW
jgi:hypothetical protein